MRLGLCNRVNRPLRDKNAVRGDVLSAPSADSNRDSCQNLAVKGDRHSSIFQGCGGLAQRLQSAAPLRGCIACLKTKRFQYEFKGRFEGEVYLPFLFIVHAGAVSPAHTTPKRRGRGVQRPFRLFSDRLRSPHRCFITA